MDQQTHRTRRRVLGMAGATVSTVLIAGCGDTEEEGDPDAEEGTGNGQDVEDENGEEEEAGDDVDEDDEGDPTGNDEDDEDGGVGT